LLRAIRNIARLLRAARVLARHDALFVFEGLPGAAAPVRLARLLAWVRLPGEAGREDADARPGQRLANALQALGPTYIKLGQFLATRPDLIGEEIAIDLTSLQDRLDPFPEDVARAVVEAELGRPLDSLFTTFSPPVAAASIAQVHCATTTAAGGLPDRQVAVKVLRPGIEHAFARDLDMLRWLAHLAHRRASLKRLRPVEALDTLSESIRIEMDLRMEAAAASEYAERLADDPWFRVPAVDWTRTAGRVLTLEWVDGLPLTDVAALRAAGLDVTGIAARLMQSFLTQALRDGFFHADMHPGNLFVDAEGRLVAVDFGIMGRLDRPTRRYLAEILMGLLARDYRRVAELHFQARFVPRDKSVDTFAQALRAIGEPIVDRPASEISMGGVLAQLFRVTETFAMETQPQLLMLQKTMVTVEGVARHIDPQLNVWETARPVLEGWVLENLGPEARLREAWGALAKVGHVLPEAVTMIDRLYDLTSAREGLRLHTETLARISEEVARHLLPHRIFFFLIVLAVWLTALVLLLR
jgi:ubiquinone biosynthesis protein